MQSSRIFIMGSGVVGTATGEGFLAAGHDVTFIDIAPERVRELRERGLDVRTEIDLTGEPDSLIFLTLPTPNDGHRYDLSAFTAGTAAVGRALAPVNAHHTVVVRSTVPPGTTEGLRAVSAAEDFAHPWMTVIASRDPETVDRLRVLLSPFGGELRTFADPAEAEFIKCAQKLGLDLDPIAATVARSAEGSINPQYGIRGGAPYGGVCLPKDTCGFLGFADTIGVDMPLLRAVVEVNEHLEKVVSSEVEAAAEQVPDADR